MGDELDPGMIALIEETQKIHTEIANIEVNLKKLAREKRTHEKYKKEYEKAKKVWAAVEENHEKLMASNPPAFYIDQYDGAVLAMNGIRVLVGEAFPDILEAYETPTTEKPPIDLEAERQAFVKKPLIPPSPSQAEGAAKPSTSTAGARGGKKPAQNVKQPEQPSLMEELKLREQQLKQQREAEKSAAEAEVHDIGSEEEAEVEIHQPVSANLISYSELGNTVVQTRPNYVAEFVGAGNTIQQFHYHPNNFQNSESFSNESQELRQNQEPQRAAVLSGSTRNDFNMQQGYAQPVAAAPGAAINYARGGQQYPYLQQHPHQQLMQNQQFIQQQLPFQQNQASAFSSPYMPQPQMGNVSAGSYAMDPTMLKILESQAKLMEQLMLNQANARTAAQPQTSPTQNLPRRSGLKGPEMIVEVFDNDILNYRSFKKMFTQIISSYQFATVEKIRYLRSKLKGDALRSIFHIGDTEADYDLAWSILDEAYDNGKELIEKCLKPLHSGKTIGKQDLDGLMSLAHEAITADRNTEELGATKETFIVSMQMRRLHPDIRKEIGTFLNDIKRHPTLNEFVAFIRRQHSMLKDQLIADGIQTKENVLAKQQSNSNGKKSSTHTHMTVGSPNGNQQQTSKSVPTCYICRQGHAIRDCPTFQNSTDRPSLLIHYKVCIYCAKHRYSVNNPCKGKEKLKCDECDGQHMTDCHPPNKTRKATRVAYTATPEADENAENSECLLTKNEYVATSTILLPTAVINIVAGNGEIVPVRAMIDQCSQSCHASAFIVDKLKLKTKKKVVTIHGVGAITEQSERETSFKIVLDDPECPQIDVKALVLERITGRHPARFTKIPWIADEKLKLADPNFNAPSQIPIILGMNVLYKIFLGGVKKQGDLLLQNTRLGWVVSGPVNGSRQSSDRVSTFATITELDDASEGDVEEAFNHSETLSNAFETQLLQFWDAPVNAEDIEVVETDACEKLFREEISRTDDGRYIVPIPWKQDAPPLGESYQTALKFYLGQEKRWHRDPKHLELSNKFMQEYIDMGHMELVAEEDRLDNSGQSYYIPYLSIMREGAVTTKLRNVFNASAKTTNGISLNQTIHAGPKLQTKIFNVISAVRKFEKMFSSDITMMFRQFLLQTKDGKRLRVLWRPNQSAPIQEYWMKTLVYGIDCSPWQAIRTLHQIADDHAPNEQVKQLIKESFYMDDCFAGADTVDECKELIKDITSTLEKGKLPLTKWMSNDLAVLEDVPEDKRISAYIDLSKNDDTLKTLGLLYNATNDEFSFKIRDVTRVTYTKRGLLSVTASIYDPIGWLLPVIMKLRMLLQTLWLQKKDWDDKIDDQTKNAFETCIRMLPMLADLRVPRWTGSSKTNLPQIVGFCDASGDGFAAVLYSRVASDVGFKITLLASKGRVCPLKTKTNKESKLCTIPKMELEGILLLAELFKDIGNSMKVQSFCAYTDSEVALAWVRNGERNENKFVKRRVTKIRKVLGPADLHYVKSAENPADSASRGQNPDKFMACPLWLTGPTWMKQETLPTTPFNDTNECCLLTITEPVVPFWERKSYNWNQVLKIMARVLRFLNNARRIGEATQHRLTEQLTADEFKEALLKVITMQQVISFAKERTTLEQKKTLPKRHWMSTLSPFMDENNILCVGGRLDRSNLPTSRRHPMLLQKGKLVDIYIRYIHEENGHAGKGLVERIVAETFWIPALGSRVKKIVNSCVICIRWNAARVQPRMGDLPAVRVNPSPPFTHVGVDLAGFFTVKASPLRFEKTMKVWIALFVCMCSKAVHLEIVSDLSAEKFMEAFARFCGRRTVPTHLYSDQATNFHGADNVMQAQWETIRKDCTQHLAIQHIKWDYTPAGSPNFGGLWEANIRIMKSFLKRMAEPIKLTYEDMTTVLCRIEGIMNSRPMTVSPTNPDDDPALTPFHLLTLRGMKLSPLETLPIPDGPLTKRMTQLRELNQHYWKRFQDEYLKHLQKRYKWKHPTRSLQVGDIVLLHDPQSPPMSWKMGRVINTYPTKQGEVRVVDVKTNKTELITRASTRLVPLLVNDDDVDHFYTYAPGETITDEHRVVRYSPAAREFPRQPMETPIQRDETPSVSEPEAEEISPTIANEPQDPNDVKTDEPRRSARIKARARKLVTTALLCWLSLVQPATALIVLSLEAGLHIQPLNTVAVKAFDLTFSVKTNLNTTQDGETLDRNLSELDSFCDSITDPKLTPMKAYCLKTREALAVDLKEVKERLTRTTKEKRASPLIAAALRHSAKYLPELALTGALAYQGYEIIRLNTEMQQMNERNLKINFLVANISTLESDAVDRELNTLIDQQMLLQLEGQIANFASLLREAYYQMELRYKQLTDLRPISELEKYLDSHKEVLAGLKLPPVAKKDDVFDFNKPKISIKKSIVYISYTIPMMLQNEYTEYLVISVPDGNGKSISLGNEKWFRTICLDTSNKTMFYPDEAIKSSNNFYDQTKKLPLSSCVAEMFEKNPVGLQSCPSTDKKLSQDILAVGRDWAVVVNPSGSKTDLLCNETQREINEFIALVRLDENCRLVSDVTQYASGLEATAELSESKADTFMSTIEIAPSFEIKPYHIDPKIKSLRAELGEELSQHSAGESFTSLWAYLTSGSGLICLLAVFAVALVLRRQREAQPQTPPQAQENATRWIHMWTQKPPTSAVEMTSISAV